ncbi:cobaltochelatase CobN subunit [Rhodoblastus acidophilus]|uniref:Cobaltochelatase CobN subunit n=1 Tax=Rhodoblastus acidophilus TaxID=1074 RepID=A0A212S187_RHOAC|nr:cobaltochelatase subunit CobN [Rhodoblastus acidophilus]PPQ38192.1 cobaltochelatase subunit CobN [Rhodoblastus acidophilus]RAI17435.1 cobaltochelatase subunit CobN [Rhodoblastus acidophilus]SNB78892.1 cobaltochelatase CobN subunit [Rhodoblastus acidophilus]
MHILRAELRSLDETAQAVDLDQSRADIVALSFTDSDLNVLAKAWETLAAQPETAAATQNLSLRLASLADLRHPYSVDLYAEKVLAHARFVIVRLLGGLDYWRYGVEELSRLVRANGARLIVVPGDAREDVRLDEVSTASATDLRRVYDWFQAGGVDNAAQVLRYALNDLGHPCAVAEPRAETRLGVFARASRPASADAPHALILFYRSAFMSGDVEPYEALADALRAENFRVEALFATSLKDPEVVEQLRRRLAADPPDVILNATAFSARLDDGSSVFDACDAPVFQVAVSLANEAQWRESARGLAPSDLAMNVALPEVDGRLFAGAVSFKAPEPQIGGLEYAPRLSRPNAENIGYAARLAAAWARLRATPAQQKKLAFVLSDYPGKGGRAGYAVGLDTFASVQNIAERLAAEGFHLGDIPTGADLAQRLTGPAAEFFDLARYKAFLANAPEKFVASITAQWGAPEQDPAVQDGRFGFAALRLGDSVVALQPDRGRRDSRKDDYHDVARPPRHAYVAFYVWLREFLGVHALVHVGAHGTLEWLPGKAVALSESCAPRAALGALPVIYPFIVNNPGEAAQAKRRTAALVLSHLTPPLVTAGAHGAAQDIEGLMDEYSEAQSLDARRARRLAELILQRAHDTGLAEEAGLDRAMSEEDALTRLDAWLCDVKEMRVGDGLHIFGAAADTDKLALLATLSGDSAEALERLRQSPGAEMDALVAALAGRRIEAGPGGAPARGRIDVLPTGRNLYAVDPRSVPTRTAWELGQRAGQEFLARYVQDHGDWPKSVVFDLWGSAAVRTGGEDLAQALALMGAKPVWDHVSNRVSGFEIVEIAALGRPRVDVTLRISGLFRDIFPEQIALYDSAAKAIAARDDEGDDNPLAQAAKRESSHARVFGAAPGVYGTSVARRALFEESSRQDLGAAYLEATGYAYEGAAARKTGEFRQRVQTSNAFVHVQDLPGQDVLDADVFADHEGGFAAAAETAGAKATLYHLDATNPQAPKARTLAEELARTLRGRAANPRWLEGQMRHGFRGAAEIAESVDNLFAFAATTNAVADRHFDLLFDATCGDDKVRDFLIESNPQAAQAIAERFASALARKFWRTRRNSVAAGLSEMQALSAARLNKSESNEL